MITYENSPVKIGDFYILAESASISIQNPARGTTRFGSPGYDSEVREGPAVGNVSVSYYMASGDENVRNLFAGDGVQLFDISVGPYQCYSGVANSMSMNIEPYSVVSCTLDMSFYNGYDQDGSIGDIPAPPSGVMHGGTTEASTDLLWADDIASVNYRMEQSISPVYALGELVPSGYSREGGTIEVDLQGTGWGHIVDTGTICEGYTTGNIRLEALCVCRDEVVYKGYWEADPLIKQWTNVGVPGATTVYERWHVKTELDVDDTDLCRPCWGQGDNVTITWPTTVAGPVGDLPWSRGISGVVSEKAVPPYCDMWFRVTELTGTACELPDITVPPAADGDSSGWYTYCDFGKGECEDDSENGVSVKLELDDWGECPDKCWEDGHYVELTWPNADTPWGDGITAQVRLTESWLCESFIIWNMDDIGSDQDPPAGTGLTITPLESPRQIVKPPYYPWTQIGPLPPDGSEGDWSGSYHDITVKNHDMSLKPKTHVIPFSGYVINPSVALEPDSEIVGSLTVFDVF